MTTTSSAIEALESFELPKALDNLASLRQFQEQAVIAAVDAAEATLRFAYHIHIICEYDLWRHEKTDDGVTPAFNSQQEYLEFIHELCASAGAKISGVSTMKAYHTALRLARSLGYDLKDVREKGISIFHDVAQMLTMNRKTGEPMQLKAGEVPDGYNITGYVREVIDEYGPDSSSDMTSHRMDIVKNIEMKLANKKPRIEFDIPNINRPLDVTWHVEMYNEDGALVDIDGNHGSVGNGKMPDYVREAWFKRVGCAWRLRE